MLRGSELDMTTWDLKDSPAEKVWIQWKEVQAARDRRISEQRTERNFFPGAVITFTVKPNAESSIAGKGYIEGTHPQFEDEEDEKDRPAELTQPLTQEATCAASHWPAAGPSAQQAADDSGAPSTGSPPDSPSGTTLDDQLFRSYLDVLPSNHTISGSCPDAGRVFDTVDVFWMHFALSS